MPRYIGYYPTGTANSSVTDSEGSVDKKYNSGVWSLGTGGNFTPQNSPTDGGFVKG